MTLLEAPPATEPGKPTAPQPAAPEAPVTSSTGRSEPKIEQQISRLRLKDGQELQGRIVEKDEQSTRLELVGGGQITIPSKSIQSVSVEQVARVEQGQVWLADRNRTRYLYAPSAMMLKQGEGYISQKELFFTSASVGVTDNLSLLAGAVAPAWFIPNAFNFIFAVKGGFSLTDNVHFAAGAESLVLPAVGGGYGFLFGTVTFGNPSLHASLSVGKPFAFIAGSGAGTIGDVIIVASGNARLNRNLALVTENWILPTAHLYTTTEGDLPFMLNAFSLRFLVDRWTVDAGVVRIPGSAVPVPWLDLSYSWG